MTTFVRRVNFPMQGYDEPVLVGTDDESRQNIGKCRDGVIYKIVPKRDNNPQFHRKVMRLIRDLYENQELIESEEMFHEYVKLQCGWVIGTIVGPDGVERYVTRSLSFEKCCQEEREKFWETLKNYASPILGHEHVQSYEGI
jgi:hypothetical protein